MWTLVFIFIWISYELDSILDINLNTVVEIKLQKDVIFK